MRGLRQICKNMVCLVNERLKERDIDIICHDDACDVVMQVRILEVLCTIAI